MDKKILLTVLFLEFAVMLPVNATITPETASSTEYLINHGHSRATAEMVEMTKATVNGETFVSQAQRDNEKYSKPIQWLRKLFIYTDPALDDGQYFMHDTSVTPSINDL